jgi:hypothetical protein
MAYGFVMTAGLTWMNFDVKQGPMPAAVMGFYRETPRNRRVKLHYRRLSRNNGRFHIDTVKVKGKLSVAGKCNLDAVPFQDPDGPIVFCDRTLRNLYGNPFRFGRAGTTRHDPARKESHATRKNPAPIERRRASGDAISGGLQRES